ncbi:MAG: hypothetical protein ACKV22_30780, partial [Bryobacteraceae bacterium]
MQRLLVLSAIATLVLAGIPAMAQSPCNQEMLRGVWCEKCTGFYDLSKFDPRVPKGTFVPISLLLRYVVNADGKGTGKGFGSFGGNAGPVEMAVTFTVNPGCTGEKAYTLKTSSGQTLEGKAGVIFMPSGLELEALIQTAGDVLSCKWKKMFHHTLV